MNSLACMHVHGRRKVTCYSNISSNRQRGSYDFHTAGLSTVIPILALQDTTFQISDTQVGLSLILTVTYNAPTSRDWNSHFKYSGCGMRLCFDATETMQDNLLLYLNYLILFMSGVDMAYPRFRNPIYQFTQFPQTRKDDRIKPFPLQHILQHSYLAIFKKEEHAVLVTTTLLPRNSNFPVVSGGSRYA